MKKYIPFLIVMALITGAVFSVDDNFSIIKDKHQVEAAGNWSAPRIYLSGGNYKYSSGGVISYSTVDEPVIEINAYNVSGTAVVDIYRANLDNLLDYLVHDEKNNQINTKIDYSNLELLTSIKHNIGKDSK